MKVVKLTNLGDKTLRTALDLSEKYQQFAPLKRAKLANLWPSRLSMDTFESTFKGYRNEVIDRIFCADNSGKPYFKPVSNDDSTLQTEASSNLLTEWGNLGLIEIFEAQDTLSAIAAEIKRASEMNPIRSLGSVVLELTGLCNLKCKHCYRGGSREGEYGLDVEAIQNALKPFLMAGVNYIKFTGGEPTLRMNDMLRIIGFASDFMLLSLPDELIKERAIAKYGLQNPTVDDLLKTKKNFDQGEILRKNALFLSSPPNDIEKYVKDKMLHTAKSQLRKLYFPDEIDSISIFSNGNFENPQEALLKLKSYGNVDMHVSLDFFDAERTDENRGKPGVFKTVLALVAIAKKVSFPLSILSIESEEKMWGGGKIEETVEKLKLKTQHVGSTYEIDAFGSSLRNQIYTTKTEETYYGKLDPQKGAETGWCTEFTDPEILHIRPTGAIGTCLFGYALPEEFGNLKKGAAISILNNLQHSLPYRLFKDGSIQKLQHELNPSLMGPALTDSCFTIILTLCYAELKGKYMKAGFLECEARKAANLETAQLHKIPIPPDFLT